MVTCFDNSAVFILFFKMVRGKLLSTRYRFNKESSIKRMNDGSPHTAGLQSKVNDNEDWVQCMEAAEKNLPKKLKVVMGDTGKTGLPKKLDFRFGSCRILLHQSGAR